MKTVFKLPFAVLPVAAALAIAVPMSTVQAADLAKGREKADQICSACHGKDGNTPIDPSYPKLGGQYREYLERALLDYQSEQRRNPIMVGQAQALSREDIRNVSAYYASLPSQLRVRR